MAALIRARPAAPLLRHVTSIRLIATSPKKSDTATAQPTVKQSENMIDFSIEGVRKSKTWVSYGFDRNDEEFDRQVMRGVMFTALTVCIVLGGFVFSYMPDPKLRDWSQREAFFQLRAREAAGLDPISPDLVDASLIELPTDEELGDTEIII